MITQEISKRTLQIYSRVHEKKSMMNDDTDLGCFILLASPFSCFYPLKTTPLLKLKGKPKKGDHMV